MQNKESSGKNYVLTIGLLCLDMIVRPVSREFFDRDSMHVDIDSLPGGDACNVALNLAAMQVPVNLVTLLGDDVNGRFLMEYLRSHGVDTQHTGTGKAGTAMSLVMVEPDGERHFLTTTDIFDEITPDLVTDDLLEGASFVTFNSFYRMRPMNGEAVAGLFRRAHRAGLETAMDTMPCKEGDPYTRILPALKETDYFLPSYEEACQITGEKSVLRMRDRLRDSGIKVLGVKLGKEGSYITDFEKEYLIPAIPGIKPVSTTGAGDSYFAGFVTARREGKSITEAAVFGTAASALTIQVPGASGGITSRESVRDLYDAYPRGQIRRIFRLQVNAFDAAFKIQSAVIEERLLPLLMQWTALQKQKGGRLVVFLAGAPGAGKSTLASVLEYLSRETEGAEPLKAAGLDGFHYTAAYLSSHFMETEGKILPLAARKGSPETFNTAHFAEKLEELAKDQKVSWPLYDRRLHDVVENGTVVEEKIVLIEGNWLLLDEDPWSDLRKLADLTIFLKAPADGLKERLISRKVKGGLCRDEAEKWYDNTDYPNTMRVQNNAAAADTVLPPLYMEEVRQEMI